MGNKNRLVDGNICIDPPPRFHSARAQVHVHHVHVCFVHSRPYPRQVPRQIPSPVRSHLPIFRTSHLYRSSFTATILQSRLRVMTCCRLTLHHLPERPRKDREDGYREDDARCDANSHHRLVVLGIPHRVDRRCLLGIKTSFLGVTGRWKRYLV